VRDALVVGFAACEKAEIGGVAGILGIATPDGAFPRIRIQHHVGRGLVAEGVVSQFGAEGIDDLVGPRRFGG
jgi:hypothetical protein